MLSFLKDFAKIFILTLILYPRPYCKGPGIILPSLDNSQPGPSIANPEITCDLIPPPLAFLKLIFELIFPGHSTTPLIDIPIILTLSFSTLIIYRILRNKKIFFLNKIKNQPLKNMILLFIIWIILMIIISVPYYFYVKSNPAPGIII